MYSVVLSGDALAMPTLSEGREAVDAYVRRILDWQFVLGATEFVSFVISERTIDALMTSGLYPFGHRLSELIDAWEIREISSNDLLRIANELLVRASFIEVEVGIEDVSWTTLMSVPDVASACSLPTLRLDLERLLALLTVAKNLDPPAGDGFVLAISQQRAINTTVAVTVDLVAPRAEMERAVSCLTVPGYLTAQICITTDSVCAVRHFDETALWRMVESVEHAKMVIRFAFAKEASRNSLEFAWDQIPQFTIRQELMDSSGHLGFRHEPPKARRFLSTVVNILLSRDDSHGHALRVNAGGNSPPRLRGKDLAWRHDIDHEFHLHLWKTAWGPEFACVVTHNDYSIPE
jgi:hypothetical protein